MILTRSEGQLKLNFGGTDDLPNQKPAAQVETAVAAKSNEKKHPQQVMKEDLMAAIEQFLPDRRDDAVAVLAELGAEKVGDIEPDNYPEAVQMLNAAFAS